MKKEISLADGRKFLITESEAQTVVDAMLKEQLILIPRLGLALNHKVVMSVAEPELEPYFWGNKMNKDKTKVFIDGEWKTFAGTPDQIEYRSKTDLSADVDKPIKENHEAIQQGTSGKEIKGFMGGFFK